MSFIEDKEIELQGKIIPQTKKADFEEFWQAQVAALRAIPLQIKRKKLDTPYRDMVTTWEQGVLFPGRTYNMRIEVQLSTGERPTVFAGQLSVS